MMHQSAAKVARVELWTPWSLFIFENAVFINDVAHLSGEAGKGSNLDFCPSFFGLRRICYTHDKNIPNSNGSV